MANITLPNPSRSSTDSNLFSDCYANDTAITAQVNGNLDDSNVKSAAGIATSKIAQDAGLATGHYGTASVTDGKLASPNNSAYRTIAQAGSTYAGGSATGTYYFGFDGTFGSTVFLTLVASGTALPVTGGGGASNKSGPQGLFNLASADYTVAGLTQKLRIRQQVIVGATSPSTVTLNCGLYPVTISAGAWTLGTVVSNSATSTSGLATNTISSFTSASGDFTIPADGAYCLGVVVGSITVPAGIHISAQLQTRSV